MDDEQLGDFSRRVEKVAEDFRFHPQLREEGRVLAVADGVARVRGLSQVGLSESVVLGQAVPGIVLDLRRDEVGVALLDEPGALQAGDQVRTTGLPISIPVGDGLLGRVVDPLGRPLDGLPAAEQVALSPVERAAPHLVQRAAVREPLATGITVVDALFPIGRGQRELIVGDRGTGKSTLALDAVINQRDTGVKCVVVSVGKQSSSAVQLLGRLNRHGARANTCVVVAAAGAPPGVRFLAPYAGCAIAEHFRDSGHDALLVLDDLSAHAVAYRELSLLLRRPPGREAYPGDIFFAHSRLLERATRVSDELGGGSLTMLPIAETHAGRISDFIPTNLISITDGQLYLEPTLFDRGIKPAVDVGLSVSRVGGKTQRPSMKAVAGRLRLDTARFHEVEVFSRFGGRVEASTQQLLSRGVRTRELLKQGPAEARSLAEQVALLLALQEGYFDSVPPEQVAAGARHLCEQLGAASESLRESFAAGPAPGDAQRSWVREALGGAVWT